MFRLTSRLCTGARAATGVSIKKDTIGTSGERPSLKGVNWSGAVLALCGRTLLGIGLMLATLVACSAQLTFSEYSGPTSPTFESNAVLVDITAGPDGNLWFTEGYAFGAQTQIGRITPAGATTYYSIPSRSSEGGITAGPDGNLWFTEYRSSKIGKLTPSGAFAEFPCAACVCGNHKSAVRLFVRLSIRGRVRRVNHCQLHRDDRS